MKAKVAVLLLVALLSYLAYLYAVHSAKVGGDPSLIIMRPMDETFSARSIHEFLPANYPCGKVYWFDVKKDKKLTGIPWAWDLYGVRIDPASLPLRVDGVKREGVTGLIGCPWIDKEINYSEENNSVIQYSVTNGVHSGGDILFLFHK